MEANRMRITPGEKYKPHSSRQTQQKAQSSETQYLGMRVRSKQQTKNRLWSEKKLGFKTWHHHTHKPWDLKKVNISKSCPIIYRMRHLMSPSAGDGADEWNHLLKPASTARHTQQTWPLSFLGKNQGVFANIRLTEISQTQKNTYCKIPLL